MQPQGTRLSPGFLLLAPLLLIANAESQTPRKTIRVDVFAASAAMVDVDPRISEQAGGFDITVHAMDGIERFESMLSQNLSSDPALARRQVQARMQGTRRPQTEMLQRTAESLGLALQYGIEKYPAVVIDGHYVIYGVTKVGRALRLYQEWQASRSQ